MKKLDDDATGPNQESEILKREVNSASISNPKRRSLIYHDTEKDLNSKILNITMLIQKEFPELSKYIEEMPMTIPDSTTPTIKIEHLKKYFDSLYDFLKKYRLDHPHKS